MIYCYPISHAMISNHMRTKVSIHLIVSPQREIWLEGWLGSPWQIWQCHTMAASILTALHSTGKADIWQFCIIAHKIYDKALNCAKSTTNYGNAPVVHRCLALGGYLQCFCCIALRYTAMQCKKYSTIECNPPNAVHCSISCSQTVPCTQWMLPIPSPFIGTCNS